MISVEYECDFRVSIKLGTWCISYLTAQLGYTILGNTRARGSTTWVRDSDTWVRDSDIWVRDSATWAWGSSVTWVKDSKLEPGAFLLSSGLYSWDRDLGDWHMHTYIVMWWNVLYVLYIIVLLDILICIWVSMDKNICIILSFGCMFLC